MSAKSLDHFRATVRARPMTLRSESVARRMRLPRAQTLDVLCERDLRVAMDDGAALLADRYVPARETAGERRMAMNVGWP